MVGRWFLGGIVGIVGIIGLFLAASAHEPGFYAFGLLIAGAAIIYIFAMIKRSFDALEH